MMGKGFFIMTLFGPLYFGATEKSWQIVFVWAGLCCLYYFWRTRNIRALAAEEAFDPNVPKAFRAFSDLAMFLGLFFVASIAHFAAYLVAQTIFT